MGDWLGTGRTRRFRTFKEARAFVRGLGLKSQREWDDYRKSGKKPVDIPTNPNRTYAEVDWAGMGDWLGMGTIAPHLRDQEFPFSSVSRPMYGFSPSSR